MTNTIRNYYLRTCIREVGAVVIVFITYSIIGIDEVQNLCKRSVYTCQKPSVDDIDLTCGPALLTEADSAHS